jgi:REP element-mobilizing transposase RayT
VVVADVAHHVTQRGNGCQFILASEAERMVYRDLLRQAVRGQGVAVVGYCLMSNHVHRVVIPPRAEALAEALKQVHGRYASYWNAAHTSSGHVWQGRFHRRGAVAGIHLPTNSRRHSHSRKIDETSPVSMVRKAAASCTSPRPISVAAP